MAKWFESNKPEKDFPPTEYRIWQKPSSGKLFSGQITYSLRGLRVRCPGFPFKKPAGIIAL